ncbi:MAG: ATP-binding cassette domain-containing protein [Alphaproteobacteria bacterium]|nr:ATP-binding cassette domain-containing protein [Alphaproteobacteria bacterium]
MTASLLSVDKLDVRFALRARRGLLPTWIDLRAVDSVSFTLGAGETLGIVGESGCGKSTLARAILRLVPAAGGRVLWLGEDLTKLDDDAFRRQRREFQIVFQDPLAALDPRMTAGAIIAEPLRTFHPELSRAATEAKVAATMRDVGLAPEHINRYPHEFSGGQCQRIGIARAIVLEPKLLVCDEPVSALDVSIQAQIINLLKRLQRDRGMAMIFISHNLAVVQHLCHRVLVLYLGKAVELAPTERLFARPLHPYTQALIAAVPVPDPAVERHRTKVVLRGDLPSPLAPPSGCPFRTRCPEADAVCAQSMPALLPAASDHTVACHHAGRVR